MWLGLWASICESICSFAASSATFPLVALKYPLVQKCFPQYRLRRVRFEFHLNFSRTSPFRSLDKIACGNMRRYRHKHMNTAGRYKAININPHFFGNLSDNIPYSNFYFPVKDRISVFRNPNNMIPDNIRNGCLGYILYPYRQACHLCDDRATDNFD